MRREKQRLGSAGAPSAVFGVSPKSVPATSRDPECIVRGAQPGERGACAPQSPAMTNEERLDQLREQAWNKGVVAGRGVDVAGGPIPRKHGYYGQSVVKPPVWSWEIPVYFFIGGFSGMAAVISLAAFIFRRGDVGMTAMWVAAIGALISPVLLSMDLGRPRLFLNMLRVFKYKSAMSVGAWIVFAFGACVIPGVIALEVHARQVFGGGVDQFLKILAGLLVCGSAFWGILLATYTGVLLGATVIPAWFYIACSCRFISERQDWDRQSRCSNCSAIESRRSMPLDLSPLLSRRRFGFGSRLTNTAPLIAPCMKATPGGSFAAVKSLAVRSRSFCA